MVKRDFDTLSEATSTLMNEGYTENFRADEEYILALSSKKKYQPADLRITERYRFEGQTNPADSMELMAIRANDGTRGTLVMSYGAKHSQNVELIREIKSE